MKTSLLAVLFAITSSTFVGAQVPDKDPFIKGESANTAGGEEAAAGVNLSAYVEFIEIPTRALHQLMRNPDLSLSDGNAVRRAVQERINEGEAKIVESALVTSASGESRIESVKEFIYPVAWDPPARLATTNVGPAVDGSDHRRFPVPMVENGIAYWPPSSFPHPTTFEERPLGIEWNQEVWAIANGREWEFSLRPGLVMESNPHSSFTMSTPFGPHEAVNPPTMKSWRPIVPKQTAPIGDTLWLGTVASPPLPETEDGVSMMGFLQSFSQIPIGNRTIAPSVFSITIEFIQVDADLINNYFQAHTDTEFRAGDLRRQLTEQLKDEEARLIDLVTLRCPLGQPASFGAVEERIYPTEFKPAQIPSYLLPNEDAESDEAELQSLARYWPPSAYPIPSAFETRNVGTMVGATVEADRNSGQLLMQIAPRIVRYLGNRVISEFRTPRGVEPLGTMPVFSTLGVTTSVYLSPGDEILLGMASPWTDEGEWNNERRVLVFAKLAE